MSKEHTPAPQAEAAPSRDEALRAAAQHIDAICIGLASPIAGEDPYGWLERAQAAQRALRAALEDRT